VLTPGEPMPDVTVYGNPGEAIALRTLVAEGPVLLVFYLFDWSST
jgi:peroxiredoxin